MFFKQERPKKDDFEIKKKIVCKGKLLKIFKDNIGKYFRVFDGYTCKIFYVF